MPEEPEEIEANTPDEVRLLALKAQRGFVEEETRKKTREVGELTKRAAELHTVIAALEAKIREGKA